MLAALYHIIIMDVLHTSMLLKIQVTMFHSFSSRVAYYGVFDGHAGPRASKFAAEHLHMNIRDKLPKGELVAQHSNNIVVYH